MALDVLVEILARQRDRLAGEEPLLALAAHGLGGGAIGRDAIDGVAVRADDMDRFGHRFGLCLACSNMAAASDAFKSANVSQDR